MSGAGDEEAMDSSAVSEEEVDDPQTDESVPGRSGSKISDVGEIIEGKRAKKAVERLDFQAPKAKEKLKIADGGGDKLGDIPRTNYEINKRKAEELKLLHAILFDRPGKSASVKKNLRLFNGFPFEAGSPEFTKKRTKMLKSYNLTNAKLKLVCTVLDLEKKGTQSDLVDRILNFLVAPKNSGKRAPVKKKRRSKKKLSGDDSKAQSKRSRPKAQSSSSGAKKSKAGSKSKAIVMDSSSDEEEEDEEKLGASVEAQGSDGEEKASEPDREEEEHSEESEESDESSKPKSSRGKKKNAAEKRQRTPAKKTAPPKKRPKNQSPDESDGDSGAEEKPKKKKVAAAKTKKADSSSSSNNNSNIKPAEDSSDDDEPLIRMIKKAPTDDQLNMYTKSKCQNCFKSREAHSLSDSDREQARPVYAGWLCLAPVGTDFDNPMQRSRKWQRRFFILYEHGSLTYALDELPSTLPQGTVNMNLCANVTDAEHRTGQRNALCIAAPPQEIFIRGETKEIINGWSERFAVYLGTSKQNQKKKRKVDPVANQDPSPAKMAATGQSSPASEAGSADSHRWQEERRAAGPDVTPVWTVTTSDPPGPEWTSAGNPPSHACQASGGSLTSDIGGRSRDSAAAGRYDPLTRSGSGHTLANGQNQTPDRSLDRSGEKRPGSESTTRALRGGAAVPRQGRTEARTTGREKLLSAGDRSQLNVPRPQRRSKSLDRRTSDTAMTPDLLNFKKGWMMKLDEDEEWKKYWFVLSTASLRYYKDSLAEESSDLEGEIDLTKCYSVTEYQVQRNYGFQIHTQKAVHTLSAMTAGIRRNWIQALMKNVRPAEAPDVAKLPGHHNTCSPPEVIPKPDVTQDSASNNVPAVREHRSEPSSAADRPGRSEDRLTAQRPGSGAPGSLELGDLERRRRRDERRRRYESLLGFSLGRGETRSPEDGAAQALSPKSQRKMEEKIAECWRQVEKTTLRPERMVTLSAEAREALELETLLQGCRGVVDELKAQLADSERRRLHLEAAAFRHKQDRHFFPADGKASPLTDIKDADGLCREHQQKDSHPKPPSEPQLSGIWMSDSGGFSPEPVLVAAASDGQREASHVDGRDLRASCDSRLQNRLSVVQKEPEGRNDSSENHAAADPSAMQRLSGEVEQLASQNRALNQRNQEMVNQLTEADREIERLKAELGSRYGEPRHPAEAERRGKATLEDVERRLGLRSQELLEAQAQISSLEESLRETEALLQLKDEKGGSEDERKAELLQRLDATEARLTELQRTCRQLEQQNAELKETRERSLQREADVRRPAEEKATGRVPAEEKVQQAIEGAATRLRALRKLLELVERLDLTAESEEEEESVEVASQLRWEERFWKSLLNTMKNDPWELKEPLGERLCEVVEGLMLEHQMVLAGHELLLHPEDECESDATKETNVTSMPESGSDTRREENGGFAAEDQLRNLKALTQTKISSLNLLASSSSSSSSSALRRLQPTADRLHSFYSSHVSLFHSAATAAFCCCLVSRLRSKHERRTCPSCVGLSEENEALKTRLSASGGAKRSSGSQTDGRSQQSAGGGDAERALHMEEAMENESPPCGEQKISDEGSDGSEEEESDVQQISALRAKVEELEEQLRVSEDKLKEEFAETTRRVQEQHEEEIAKLKATCERGLVAVEDCHLRVVEELQRLHQQEVERLLVERERLLEEESAATATAIEAIKNAHRAELQREVQRRSRSENFKGNAQLEEIHRQHREELASFQRELDVLSQQFSLKCLENGHLVQALDAERKALCQCQQENQDLRSRNQELSGHLAAEMTRLCSLAKQDQLPLGQRMDVYEMAITLRVKESEVQCLKQEVASLKEELQAAVKDKRNVTKKYKDVHTELSIIRAKAEQEAEALRENLRLAHQALEESSP